MPRPHKNYLGRTIGMLGAPTKRIDQLFSLLEQARTTNHKLEQECEHLATMIAASPDNASILPTH